ncbi:MAG: 2'-5' RNA ligase family protein [Pirellulales bacterium]
MSRAEQGAIIFAALEPDARLAALIQGYKHETRTLVGEQQYLGDAPHLTVYLAAFRAVDEVVAQWRQFARRHEPIDVQLIGWHVFEADALTGSNTLICDLAAGDKHRLRNRQTEAIELLAPLHDVALTRRRIEPRLAQLTDEQRACVERFGFPYVGDGWEPHLTIASIRPADWPAVWSALGAHPPVGAYRCARWRLYQLVGEGFRAIDGLGEAD